MADTFRTTGNGWSYTKSNGETVNLFESAPMETAEFEAAEWDALNDRQKAQAEGYANLAMEYGMFDQSSMANGAHYAPAAVNPFKANGLVCSNCIFFNEQNNQCQIVTGEIEPEAICKLWVIPESMITE